LVVWINSPPSAIVSRNETDRCVPDCHATINPAGALARGWRRVLSCSCGMPKLRCRANLLDERTHRTGQPDEKPRLTARGSAAINQTTLLCATLNVSRKQNSRRTRASVKLLRIITDKFPARIWIVFRHGRRELGSVRT
jgi:hypothetical protein